MEINTTLLEAILSIMPGNFYWKSRDGIYLGCNENTANMLKLKSRHDVVGKTIYQLVERHNADMVTKNDEFVMATNQELTVEEHVKDEDGERFYLTKKIPLHDEKGKVTGLLGISFDITERKKIELELKNAKLEQEIITKSKSDYINKMSFLEEIITLLPGNVYWKNKDGVYLGCNDNMAQILNLSSHKQIVGKTAYDLVSKKHADLVTQQDEKIMLENKNFTLEENGLDIQGNPATYLTKKVPLHNDSGEVIGILGLSFDITERKKLEELLQIAKEKAEMANNMKTEFIRNMEHDIRTPFGGIFALANILELKEENPEKKEYLRDISRSAKELLDYCNVVLDFSNIEAGGFPILEKKFDIKNLAESIIHMEVPSAKYKKLKFTLDYDKNIPTILMGDPYRLQRVMINLVSNAIKFTEKGYVKLTLRLASSDNTRAILKIIIEDSGIGIAKETQNFLYEKFSRALPSNKGIHKGMGLGLRAVKQFIQEMEGEIDVETEIGKGTIFTCTLPLRLPLINN